MKKDLGPEISVIVPVYKVEKYLDRCVESIVNQTYRDFELILVDDGSPDNCPAMCDAWARKDERIRVVHKENGGASAARNAGLDVARGAWISFVDSDDWIEKNTLEILCGAVQKYEVPMAISGMKVVREHKARLNDSKLSGTVIKWPQKELLDRFFRVHGEPDIHGVWGMLIRWDVLRDYRFVEGRMNEDVEASYYLARKCEEAVYIDIPCYNYFYNMNGMTNSGFNKKKLDLLEIWDIVQKQVAQYTPEYLYACKMNCKRARFTLLTQMNLNGYDHNDPFMNEIKKKLKKEVRQSFFELMKWKMPLSRKILLTMECFL